MPRNQKLLADVNNPAVIAFLAAEQFDRIRRDRVRDLDTAIRRRRADEAANGAETPETVQRAFELVPCTPRAIRGDALANAVGVTAGHLRKEIIPALKVLGVVTTRNGYQRPAP